MAEDFSGAKGSQIRVFLPVQEGRDIVNGWKNGKASKTSENEAELMSACELTCLPRGRSLPLNSKRITAVHLRQVAGVSEFPTEGSTDQLRQTIEGRLETDGHGAANVQVILSEDMFVETRLFFVGESGVILESGANEANRAREEPRQGGVK